MRRTLETKSIDSLVISQVNRGSETAGENTTVASLSQTTASPKQVMLFDCCNNYDIVYLNTISHMIEYGNIMNMYTE